MEQMHHELAANGPDPGVVDQSAQYQETILHTDNIWLVATMCVFGAQLKKPALEWVDIHKSRESYVRYLEDRANGRVNPENLPTPQVTFNFDGETLPRCVDVVQAFDVDLAKLDSDFETLLADVPNEMRDQIRDAASRLIARACHEVLLKRDELVRQIKRMPNNAKFDQISHGKRIVRLGKNCSPELRQHYLSKLPA